MFGVVVIICAVFSGSQAFKIPACLNTEAIKALNIPSLAGTWYELYSYGMPFTHKLEKCLSSTITPSADGKSFSMANDRIEKMFKKHIKINWEVVASGDQPTGDLSVSVKLPYIGKITEPFKILGTDDYKNYFIFHSCLSIGGLIKSNIAFVLTKKRQYEAKELESLNASIDEVLTKNGLDRSKFAVSNQQDCGDVSTAPTGGDSASLPSGDVPPSAPQTA